MVVPSLWYRFFECAGIHEIYDGHVACFAALKRCLVKIMHLKRKNICRYHAEALPVEGFMWVPFDDPPNSAVGMTVLDINVSCQHHAHTVRSDFTRHRKFRIQLSCQEKRPREL